MKTKRIDPVTGLILLIFLVAFYVALYPVIRNTYSEIGQTTIIQSYEEAAEKAMTKEMWNDANAYNEELSRKWKDSVFTYLGEEATDETYESCLGFSGGVMCTVEIPSVSIHLPVGHGTSAEVLDGMAGHMYGTSLPVGGSNTNAVIAAHTGLSTAKLFNDLDQVKEGDYFYIHVLDRILCYEVVAIYVCTPEEDYHYLQIEEGKDIVTLYTCTPYGINDHRLILKGEHRSDLDLAVENTKTEEVTIHYSEVKRYLKIAILVLVPPGLLWVIYKMLCRERGDERDGS